MPYYILLHIKVKFIAFVCHEICNRYKIFSNMLEIIKTLCTRWYLNSDLCTLLGVKYVVA
jgi:hypothetical protein